jgi:hypothetical protein
MRRHAKGTPTPIDESRSHSRRFSADAIEGVIGDKEHLVHADPNDLRCFCVGREMWLESIGNRDRDHSVKGNSVVALRGFRHIGITIGENHQRITRLQSSERLGHLGKWSQPFDMSNEVVYLVERVGNTSALQDESDGAMANLAVRGMFAVSSASIIEFSKWVRRHHVTKELGSPRHPFAARKGAAASVNPVCMSTTVPYWSNMQTLMVALKSSACAIAVLTFWRAIADHQTHYAVDAVNTLCPAKAAGVHDR